MKLRRSDPMQRKHILMSGNKPSGIARFTPTLSLNRNRVEAYLYLDANGTVVLYSDVQRLLFDSPPITIDGVLAAPRPTPTPVESYYRPSTPGIWSEHAVGIRTSEVFDAMGKGHDYLKHRSKRNPVPDSIPHMASWMTYKSWARMFREGETGYIRLGAEQLKRFIRTARTVGHFTSCKDKLGWYAISCVSRK